MKENIIIDCDPGHDDVMAILLALANQDKLNILGVTTVAGNQSLNKVTYNLRRLYTYLGISTPIASGAGDTFNGAFATAIVDGYSIDESILFANKAAAISVTKFGAQSGMPYREDL